MSKKVLRAIVSLVCKYDFFFGFFRKYLLYIFGSCQIYHISSHVSLLRGGISKYDKQYVIIIIVISILKIINIFLFKKYIHKKVYTQCSHCNCRFCWWIVKLHSRLWSLFQKHPIICIKQLHQAEFMCVVCRNARENNCISFDHYLE